MTKLQKAAGGGFLAFAAAVALCLALGVSNAFAAGITSVGGDGASWTVPTNAMTNTVWKDADGNLVDEGTEGATQYKVLTTWAEAWATSGPDYLGISNSAYYGNGGNGNPKVETFESAQKNTTVGVWATSANESPNAYNWNMFYNLYCDTDEGILTRAEKSDWTSTITAQNGGTDWSTEAGVWCGFKYRPDVVWINNNLSVTGAEVYIDQIRNGQYSATATLTDGVNGSQGGYIPDPEGDGTYNQNFYVYNDENYDPVIISTDNNCLYSFLPYLYKLTAAVQKVTATTADYEGLADGEALDWMTVNKLPRSSRYSESPTECAVNVEKLARGSVYYTLAKIADGTTTRKKVAFVAYPWNYSETGRDGSTTTYTTETQVIVEVNDYVEYIGNGPMDGRAAWVGLPVDQLATDTVYAEKAYGGTAFSGDGSTTTYTLYTATADDLADCDVIYCSPNVTADAGEFQGWIEEHASSDTTAAKAANIDYLTTWPCLTNGSNGTIEKMIYGNLGLDFIYPELFPSMELSSYWCDQIYHLKDDSLASAMSWIYASSSLPEGVSLSSIPANYKAEEVEAKLDEGLAYYQNSLTDTGSTDPTINRLLNNIAIDGTTEFEGYPYDFKNVEPSSFWIADVFDATQVFSDVQDPTAWFYKAICYVAANGLIVGYDNSDLYGVGDTLTRAQLATILWRNAEPEAAANYDASTAVNSTGMSDVENGMYYTAAANWAVENGVINGFENADGSRTFEPDTAVTFEQMMVILANHISDGANQDYPTTSLSKFTDGNDVDTWAASSLAWAKDNGYYSGYKNDDGTRTIKAYEEVGRERCATVLYNIILQGELSVDED